MNLEKPLSDSIESVYLEREGNLPMTADALDAFNADIQAVIEVADRPLALKLALVKQRANRRFYWSKR